MNREELIEELKAELGHPTIRVDIDDTVWDKIFSKAYRWFNAKKGLIKQHLQLLQEGILEYDWPADAYAIVDVVVPRRSDLSDILSLGFFDIVPAQFVQGATTYPATSAAGAVRFDVGAYVQLLQTLEMRRRVFSAEPDWYVYEHPVKKIVLTNRNPVGYTIQGTSLYAVFFYKGTDISIPDFIGRDADLFYRYCLAKAKMIQGTIRSKYSQYPAAGGTVSMDGSELKAEAQSELAQLEIEIEDSQGNAGGILVG